MSLDIYDAESSFLKARAEFNTWLSSFYERWLKTDLSLFIGASVFDANRSGIEDDMTRRVEILMKKLTGKE